MGYIWITSQWTIKLVDIKLFVKSYIYLTVVEGLISSQNPPHNTSQ